MLHTQQPRCSFNDLPYILNRIINAIIIIIIIIIINRYYIQGHSFFFAENDD